MHIKPSLATPRNVSEFFRFKKQMNLILFIILKGYSTTVHLNRLKRRVTESINKDL